MVGLVVATVVTVEAAAKVAGPAAGEVQLRQKMNLRGNLAAD